MSNTFSNLVLGAVLLVGASVVAAPWYVVYQMRSAAEAGDSTALAQHIDFPALRESLKAHVNEMLAAQAAARPDDGQAFAAMLLGALVDPMVDALITPQSLAHMMAGSVPATPADPEATDEPAAPEAEFHKGYEAFDRFAITLRLKENGQEPVVFLLHRQGIWSWKLASMRLAMPALVAPPEAAESEAYGSEEAEEEVQPDPMAELMTEPHAQRFSDNYEQQVEDALAEEYAP